MILTADTSCSRQPSRDSSLSPAVHTGSAINCSSASASAAWPAADMGVIGKRSSSRTLPCMASAALTGAGLGSANRRRMTGSMVLNRAPAAPWRPCLTRWYSCAYRSGRTWAAADMAPWPPIDRLASSSASSPHSMSRRVSSSNSANCCSEPPASLMATKCESRASRAAVAGVICTPVRAGTLYSTMDWSVAAAISWKWRTMPSCDGRT